MVVDTLDDAVSRAPAFFGGAFGSYVIHKSCAKHRNMKILSTFASLINSN